MDLVVGDAARAPEGAKRKRGPDDDDPLRFFETLERNIAKATSGKKLIGSERLDLLEPRLICFTGTTGWQSGSAAPGRGTRQAQVVLVLLASSSSVLRR